MRTDLTRTNLTAMVRAVDDKEPLVEAVISTGLPDRSGTIILASAFERHLPVYRENPILCWGHPLNSWSSPGPDRLIGRAEELTIEPDEVRALFRYAVNENPMAKLCYDMVQGGFLRAYSVGCLVRDAVFLGDPKEKIDTLPEGARRALQEGEVWAVFTEVELIEVSQVFVGSNRAALVKAAELGKVDALLACRALSAEEPAELLALVDRLSQLERQVNLARATTFKGVLRAASDDDEEEQEEVEAGSGGTCSSCGAVLTCPSCGDEEKALEDEEDDELEQALAEVITLVAQSL